MTPANSNAATKAGNTTNAAIAASDPAYDAALEPACAAAAARRSPGGAKSRKRIEQIMQAGREVFAERGFETATTADIAQRAGISEATVFSYFASKRELCARVIAQWYEEIIAAIEHGLPRHRSVREQFGFIVHAHLRLMLGSGTGLCALVLSEGRAPHHALAGVLIDLQRRYTHPLMQLLADGRNAGEIRTDIPLRLMRSMIFGPMEHVLWDAVLTRQSVDIELTAAQLVEVLWTGLRTPDAEQRALRQFRETVRLALHELG